MAAPSSKQSPSNQKMHESGTPNEHRLKDPPPSSIPQAATAASASPPAAAPPSYAKSETCESYVLAKQLLNNDNFEEALTVIEEELIKTTTEIRASLGLSLSPDPATTNAELETEIELHEALAPLHYLYGTTLLYSLEEAKGDGNAMMTEAASRASTTATPAAAGASPDPTNPWAHLPSNTAAADPNAGGEDAAAATAEDIQIAWENLEAARTIVEKMLLQATTATKSSGLSELQVAKLQLDLAQIHLREGDLQRINGNYTSAVGDYSSCLEILLRHNNTKDEQNNIRDLNRKIADTQFNLGLTYLTSSSDLQKEVASANASANNPNPTAATAGTSTTADQREKAALLAREHCEKGIQQHVDCARTFCGIVARLCGVDPETILVLTDSDKEQATSEKKPAAGFKTTGLDDETDQKKAATSATADASQTLNVWRKALATMVISHSPQDAQDALRVSDILQVLDEIQETIDEAERSQEGVLQAAEIRVKAQQAAAMDGDSGAAVANPDGSTTTIGFGHGTASVAATAAVISTTAASKPAADSDAKPMMVVKKKKKRKDATGDGCNKEEGEATKPAPESDSNKRAKTE